MKSSLKKLVCATAVAMSLVACSASEDTIKITELTDETKLEDPATSNETTQTQTEEKTIDENTQAVQTVQTSESSVLDVSNIFTERDLTQTVDTSTATTYTVKDGEDITINAEGVYVLTGSAKDVTVYVEAASEDKVQIVLDNVSITNTDFPCIYVKSADKVFITTTNTENTLEVTGTFKADGDTNTDGVIFSKDDIIVNGTGTLTINSTNNGIVSKDDLKVTGGTITITATNKGLQAHDSVAIADGSITIEAGDDGVHVEDDEDNTVGYFYMAKGTLNITSGDDAIHATTVAQIDDGTLKLNGAEGLEATYIQVNAGEIEINASDDGINAANKSNAYAITAEFNGGNITVNMGQGDTDAIDSNGNIYVNGGTLNINAQSPFDYDGQAQYNGGTIIANGQETNQITNQMMGGGMMGQKPSGGMTGGPSGQPPQGGMGGKRPH